MIDVPLTIVIHAHADDLHSLLVATALQERGHRVVRNFSGDLGASDSLTMSFENGPAGGKAHLHSGPDLLDLDQVDVVWNRNPRFPRRAGIAGHVGGEHARAQLRIAQEAMCVLTDGAFWINPLPAARRSALKPLQLRMAPAAGLSIPASLVSNSPGAIRDFVVRHTDVICRPLHGHQLKGLALANGESSGSRSAIRINRENLSDDNALRAIPALYQAYRPQQQRVRVQIFGDTSFAVRVVLPVQASMDELAPGPFDTGDSPLFPIELPRAVHRSCKILMDSLKLVVCAFDFMLGPGGEWTFMELHESAPFMFIETWCPELTVLDAFCAFLESRDADFVYQPPQQPCRLEGFERTCDVASAHDPRRKPANDALARAVAF